jgi:hypothetical protein
MKNWTRIEEKESPYVKVYEHNKTGNIKVVYPRTPKWAQKAAMLIYNDLKNGPPTEKGVKDIVRGTWAKMISEAAKGAK